MWIGRDASLRLTPRFSLFLPKKTGRTFYNIELKKAGVRKITLWLIFLKYRYAARGI
jgi:hypothetical protein